MNILELEKANELRDQIRELERVVVCLEKSIETHKDNSKIRGYKRTFRFLNAKMSAHEETKAKIFLFNGLSIHGIDIPVDQEICEKMFEIFKNRLEEKQNEFANIGRSE